MGRSVRTSIAAPFLIPREGGVVGSVTTETAKLALRAYYDGTLGDPFKRPPRNVRNRSIIVSDPTGPSPLENILPIHVTAAIEQLDAVPQWIVIQHIKLRTRLSGIAEALEMPYTEVLDRYGRALQAIATHLSKVI